jgi:hypothetical protein
MNYHVAFLFVQYEEFQAKGEITERRKERNREITEEKEKETENGYEISDKINEKKRITFCSNAPIII